MMYDILKESLQEFARYTFTRSGGPGGQNVNKVNTKVCMTIDLSILAGLSGEELDRVRQRLSNRLLDTGYLVITVDEERSQFRNREIAQERAFRLISSAAKPEKKRIPTKPGKAAKLKRLKTKKTRASIKTLRSKPVAE